MTDRLVRVKLEGDGASLDAALAKSTSGAEKLTAAVGKTSKAVELHTAATSKSKNASEAFFRAADRATAATDKLTKSGIKASQVAVGFGKAAKAAEGGVMGVAQSAVAAATAFGPWGVAIGLVGSALINYVNDANAAEKATRELGEEAVKRVRDARLAREQEGKDAAEIRKAEQEAAYQQSKREAEVMSRRTELRAIEDALDATGRGKDNIALLREEARILSDNALTMGDIVGSEQIIRDREREINVLLHKQNETRKSIAETEKGRFGPDIQRTMRGMLGTPSNIDAENERRRFNAEANSGPLMRNNLTDPTEAAANRTDAQLRAIEVQRATTGESIDLINQEEQARLRLLQVQSDAATIGAERAAFAAEMEQVQHDAALARIAQRQAAEEAAIAKRVEWADVSAGIASGAIATTNMAVAAAGVSGKKAEKIAGRLAGVQAMFIGGLEMVKAAAAFASLNIPQGVAHAAAGAFAFVQGGLMLSGALPTGAGGGGGGASAASTSSGPTQAANTPNYNTGPIPGSPGPQTPSTGTSGTQSGGTTNNTFYISGVIGDKRAVMREIDEGLGQLGHHGRPRRDR